MWDDIWALFLATRFPQRVVSVITRSGRHFRFNITDYRVFPGTSKSAISSLASEIVEAKYRYCEWNRCHPQVNSEVEILESVTRLLTSLVEEMRSLQEKCNANGKLGPEQIISPETVVTHTVDYSRPRRKRSETRMAKVWGVFDNTGELVEYFDFRSRPAAEARAEELIREMRAKHFVAASKQPIEESEIE